MSGYSDQFFDAEDIVLSGGEDEDDAIEAGSSIDDESSDEDSGRLACMKQSINGVINMMKT